MSIFSRLRRRGDEGSAESPPNAQPSAPAPKASSTSPAPPAARAPEPGEAPGEVCRITPAHAVRRARACASARIERAAARQRSIPVAGAIATPMPLAPPRAPIAKVAAPPAAKASPFPAATPVAAATAAPAPIAVAEPAGGSLDLAIALALESNAAPEKPAAAPAPGHWQVDRVRRGRPARDVRGAGRRARRRRCAASCWRSAGARRRRAGSSWRAPR